MYNPYSIQTPPVPWQYGQMPQMPATQQTSPQMHIDQVHGRTGAENYQIGPDSSTLLMDTKDQYIWMVLTDSSATKKIVRLKVVIDDDESVNVQKEQKNDDVTQNILDRLDVLEKRFKEWEDG